MPSSLAPSTETSRPSTFPVTVILPVTSIPAPKLTFASKSDIIVLNALPSPVLSWKVLFAEYHSVLAIPATAAVVTDVKRPSAPTVIIGIEVPPP